MGPRINRYMVLKDPGLEHPRSYSSAYLERSPAVGPPWVNYALRPSREYDLTARASSVRRSYLTVDPASQTGNNSDCPIAPVIWR